MRLYSPHYLDCIDNSSREIRSREDSILKSISPKSQQYADSATQKGSTSHPGTNNDYVHTSHMEKEHESITQISNAPSAIPTSSLSNSLSPQQGVKRRQPEFVSVLPAIVTHSSSSKRAKQGHSIIKTIPQEYELCPIEDLVILISNMIEELIHTNDNLPLRSSVLTRFHSRY